MATNLFDLYAKISLDDSDFNSGIDKALAQGSGLASKLGTAFTGISNVGKKAFKAVGVVATAGGVALGAFMKSSIDAGMQFDAAMSQVGAISGATGEDFDALREKAMEMGAKTKFSATESAEAMNYMAMAGWKTEDMLNSIEGVMNLAAASGEDLARTSDIVTDAMTAFGLAADESTNGIANATHFADVLAASAANSNTNVTMLGESFKYVAPIAGSMGYSIEDTAVALGVMANNGIKASQGGTALRNIITNMAKPTSKMKAAMDALGVSLTDENGNVLSLIDLMRELRKGFNDGSLETAKFKEEQAELQKQLDNGEISAEEYDASMESLAESVFNAAGANKAQYASMLAGKYSMAGLLAIVNTTDEEFDKLTESIYNCDGAAEQMANTMLDNLNGDVTILKSSLEGLQIAVSDEVTPSLRDFAQQGTKYINRVKDALTSRGWSGAIKEIGNIFGEVLNQFISYLPQMADFATQMIVALIDGISANSGSMIEAGSMLLDSITSGLSQIREKVMPVISQFVPLVLDYFMTYKGQMFSIGLDIITAIVQGIGDNMASIGQSAGDMLTTILTSIQENLPTLITAGLNIISGLDDYIIQNLSILLDSGMQIITQLMSAITTYAPDLLQSAIEILSNIGNFIIEQLPTLLTFGADLIQQVITTITESLPSLVTSATDILNNIANFLIENLPGLLTMGVDIINQIITTITESLPELVTIATDILTNIVDFLVENLPGILTMGADLISQIVTTISESIPDLATSAVDILNQIVSSIIENLPKILDVGLDLINQLTTSISENLPTLIQSGIDLLQEILSGFVDEVPKLVAEIPGMIEQIVTSVGENLPSIITAGGDILSSILEGFTSLFTDIPAVISDLWDSFKTAVDDIDWASIGTNLIDGVQKGIKDAWENAKKAVTDAFDGLVGGIKDLLGIHSPSTVFEDIGDNMVAGVKDGWDDNFKGTKKGIEGDLDFDTNVRISEDAFKKSGKNIAAAATDINTSISKNFNEASQNVSKANDGITLSFKTLQSTISNIMNSILNAIRNAWNNINTNINTSMNNMNSTVSRILNNIESRFESTFNNVVNTVRNAVSTLKDSMNFRWELPRLKMPHIKIKGSFSMDPPSAPEFSVSWYRKAMNNAMLLNGATIFGAMGDKLLGGGEAGQEVVSGADTLMGMIKDAVGEAKAGIGQVIINIDGAQYEDADELANVIAEKIQGIVDRRSAAWA